MSRSLRARRTLPPGGVDGAIPMTFGMLAERPGSQLDLVAEAGVEQIGPSTIEPGEPAEPTLF